MSIEIKKEGTLKYKAERTQQSLNMDNELKVAWEWARRGVCEMGQYKDPREKETRGLVTDFILKVIDQMFLRGEKFRRCDLSGIRTYNVFIDSPSHRD